MMEKFEYVVMLMDFYGPLLTKKQQHVLSLHYENDWSLSEIANNMQISRQAVYDLLKRAENSLQDYEERLGLLQRFLNTQQEIDEVYHLLNNAENIKPDNIYKAANILRKISNLV
ncbi:MAG: YlxM family DNA-binding protein [Syntrophomonadaceae bacterium]|nr:YlxM family DNA-binding protein [Syntrophomonadaceae bacterium]MDD3022530.1 YlxM family DNA-binding protein [Syntrophomonadaceae bacterium]